MNPVPSEPYAFQARVMDALIGDILDTGQRGFDRLEALRAAQAIEARSDGTVEQGPARRARARSGTDAPNLSSPSLNKEDGE
jgi:hypothetical protein